MATFKKIKSAQKVGKYRPTAVDQRKKIVDFRLMQVSPYVIKWKDGTVEVVHGNRLKTLQKKHTWTTDF